MSKPSPPPCPPPKKKKTTQDQTSAIKRRQQKQCTSYDKHPLRKCPSFLNIESPPNICSRNSDAPSMILFSSNGSKSRWWRKRTTGLASQTCSGRMNGGGWMGRFWSTSESQRRPLACVSSQTTFCPAQSSHSDSGCQLCVYFHGGKSIWGKSRAFFLFSWSEFFFISTKKKKTKQTHRLIKPPRVV